VCRHPRTPSRDERPLDDPDCSTNVKATLTPLQDLPTRLGKARTAERPGVSERTVRRSLEPQHLSWRMTSALLREQNELRDQRRLAREARLESLVEQVQQLERRLGEFEQVTGEQLDEPGERVAAAAQHAAEAKEQVALGALAVDRPGTATTVVAPRRVKVQPERLLKLVTVEPAEDDAAVYREALPHIAEWRRCLVARKAAPHTYAWLQSEDAQARMLQLEIELIEERELTLPAGELPWARDQRRRELRRRNQRLGTARSAPRRRRWRRRLVRGLSLGLLGG